MDLSIIIVNFNTASLLQKCLASIIDNNQELIVKNNLEIIVIDNCSTDESREVVKKNYPHVKLLVNNTNLGFGKANNQGIEKAQGEYILLLNTDTFAKQGALENLLSFARKQQTPCFIGGKLFNENGTSQPSCGPFYNFAVIFAMLFLKGDKWGLTRFSPNKITQTDWVSGACLLGKKENFENVGMFDENIFMYMDEIDFLYRAKKKRYKVIFYPDAHFTHLGSASSEGNKEPVLNIYRGLIYFYYKHHPLWQRFLLIFMLKLKALIAFLIGFLTNNHYLKNTYAKALKLA